MVSDMRCPDCQQEMEQGFIHSSRELLWGPKGHVDYYDEASLDLNENTLRESFYGSDLTAWYCRDCNLLLANPPQKEKVTLETVKRHAADIMRKTIKKIRKIEP